MASADEPSGDPARPDEPATGCSLVVITGPCRGQKFRLTGESLIGRGHDCDVVVSDPGASRHHARIREIERGVFEVVDLGSANGTRVNDCLVPPDATFTIYEGDQVQVGASTIFKLSRGACDLEERRERLTTLGLLTAGAAHDLNNMLTAITVSVAYLNELPTTERGSADATACLEDIAAATTRATELTSGLLTLAGSGHHTDSVGLTSVCAEAVSLARRTFPSHIRFKTNIAPNLWISGNGTQLYRVLVNLLVNARDALSSQGGTIQLEAFSESFGEEREAIVRVIDDGCGFDASVEERIFESFFTTKAQGTGLGLATVVRIVRGHGGSMAVQSAPAQGATFTLRFPMSRVPPERHETVRLADGQGAEGTILLVVAEPVLERSLSRLLESVGYQVVSAAREDDAQLLAAEEPRLRAAVVALSEGEPPPPEKARGASQRFGGIPVLWLCDEGSGWRDADEASGVHCVRSSPLQPNELMTALQKAIGDHGA